MKDFLVGVWRSAVRERSYALINLAGLALGFACCLLLGLYLRGELTYDRHFSNHGRIYRVVAQISTASSSRETAYVPRAGAPMMAADYPQIQAYVRFTDASLQDGLRLHYGEKVLSWRQTYFADDSVFKVFSHQVLAGDPATALTEPSTVAVSQTLARAYFGDENPIGRLLRTDAGEDWKVTLVFADLPPNTHLRYDALFAGKIPLLRDAADRAGLRKQLTTGYAAYTYLLMAPGFDPADWDRMARAFVDRYIAADARRAGNTLRILLQPLTKVHYADPTEDEPSSGNRGYLYGCMTVAVFILLVACINYTNLGAARALRRARSVALRKILGARRGRLLLECLGEAVLYALAATALALALTEVALSLTPIGALLGQQVRFDLSAEPGLLASVLGAAVVIGIVAGAWPSVYLSAWLPAAAFSRRGGGAASGARLREALVLVQFVMAVGVVSATLVMGAQMHFMANAPLGFEPANQVMVTVRGTANFTRIPALEQELRRDRRVLDVTQTGNPPGRYPSGGFIRVEDARGVMQQIRGSRAGMAPNFTAVLGMHLLAGRNLTSESPGSSFLVNETLVKSMGWSDAIGRRVEDGRVVGVVRDFHFRPLREPVEPMVIQALNDDPSLVAQARRPFVQRTVIIHVSGEDVPGVLKYIGDVMTRFDPGNPFQYSLLDDDMQGAYSTERRMLTLVGIFATLCVFIACLGLFGLTAFSTERRAREIAVRKVLGASARQVVMLLARRFLLLIGLGGIVAAVAAWIVMDEWLAGFAYRVNVNPLLLLLAIALVGTVALATMAMQSLRSARADPAEVLRWE
jgi:putative ABC transport system permease protein